MIKANELRIGNWVSNGNDMIKILGTGLTYFYYQPVINGVAQDFECITLEKIKAEPLSDSLLIKCGFVKSGDWFYKGHFILGYITDDSHFQTEYKMAGVEGDWKILDITSLHQLQNLYFALTGSELTL